MNPITTVLGSQWGDEGKGKLVDILARQFDIVARCQGGSNAGHTIVVEGKRFAFHLLPSGILHPQATCVIGNGVVVHLPTLFKELENLDANGIDYQGRIKISERSHIVLDVHQTIDGMKEDEKGEKKLGTTKRGIGPTYADKARRSGLRVGDLHSFKLFEKKLRALVADIQRAFEVEVDVEAELERYRGYAEKLKPLIIDSVAYVNQAHAEGKSILIEGANATMLDIDFGTYPYVTSSNCSIGGACTGLGIAPSKLGETIGIVKAYTTRVGAGPFPTELDIVEGQSNPMTEPTAEEMQIGQAIRDAGHEYGTTTGRPRRCGWFDPIVVKYAHLINNFTAINITKLDVLDDVGELKIATSYNYQGQKLDAFPSRLEVLEQVEVEYETLPGWKTSIRSARSFEELPEAAQNYVKRIEELVGCPVKWIGVGPGREEMIQV